MFQIVEAYRAYSGFTIGEVFLKEEDALKAAEYDGMYDEGYTLVDEYLIPHGFYDDYFDAEVSLCEREGGVAIGPDFIAIYDNDGTEIVRWVENEWTEEPGLAINLANAVRLYYTKGPAFIKKLLGK